MLQTRVVGNIGVLIYDYVIPTMQTRSSNDKFLNNPIRYSKETTTLIWISTQPISNYYGDTEKIITF